MDQRNQLQRTARRRARAIALGLIAVMWTSAADAQMISAASQSYRMMWWLFGITGVLVFLFTAGSILRNIDADKSYVWLLVLAGGMSFLGFGKLFFGL